VKLALLFFLHAKNTVLGKSIADNGVECSKMGERTNVHDEEQSGRPAICSE
jgi:hypothetical protein